MLEKLSRTCASRSATCSGTASLYGLKISRTEAPSSEPALNSGLADAIVIRMLLSFGRIRSRVSSHSVCASPGFTEKVKFSMSRIGHSGSRTSIFIGT